MQLFQHRVDVLYYRIEPPPPTLPRLGVVPASILRKELEAGGEPPQGLILFLCV